jgi:hypothetical protein
MALAHTLDGSVDPPNYPPSPISPADLSHHRPGVTKHKRTKRWDAAVRTAGSLSNTARMMHAPNALLHRLGPAPSLN